MTSPPQLTPLGPAQVVDHAIRLVLRNFKPLAIILAVIWAPWALLEPLYSFTSADDVRVIDGQLRFIYDTESALNTANLVSFLLVLIGAVAAGVALLAMVRRLTAAYVGDEPPTWGEAITFGFGRFLPLLWIIVLLAAMLFVVAFVFSVLAFALGPVAFIVFVGLGLWIGVSWAVVLPALVVEDERGVAALRRSFTLVRGRWWATFGALLVAFIILFAVQFGVAALVVGALEINSEVVVLALVTLISILLNFLVFPFWAGVQTVIYYDLRVRKEGLDLQLLTRELRMDAEGPPAPPPIYPPAEPAGSAPPPLPPREPAPPIGLDTPPPEGFAACPDCGRHRAVDVVACPFCGSAVR